MPPPDVLLDHAAAAADDDGDEVGTMSSDEPPLEVPARRPA